MCEPVVVFSAGLKVIHGDEIFSLCPFSLVFVMHPGSKTPVELKLNFNKMSTNCLTSLVMNNIKQLSLLYRN